MKKGTLRQLIALFLCFAMILPNFSGIVYAAETGDSSASTQTDSSAAFDEKVLDSLDYGTIDTGAKVSQWLEMDGGNSLKTDAVNGKSHMQVATETSWTSFESYCKALKNSSNYNAADSDMSDSYVTYSRFTAKDKTHSVYAYYLKNLNEARVIVDTHKDMTQTYSGGFAYGGGNAVTDTVMVMYALSMSENGYDQSSTAGFETTMRNCGALIVIRMPDNSLFIHDGGDIQQWSDAACANFMQFCRDLTGVPEGEKVVLNTWFVSHAHSDHFNGFPRFLSLYQDQVDLKNVMYNIDDERAGTSRDMGQVMQMISTAYPGVKYYKPHTGESFEINGIQFDVMYTQEDRFYTSTDGQELAIDKSDKGGTYRDECFTEYDYTKNDPGSGEKVYCYGSLLNDSDSDFNDTSTVLKVTFPTSAKGVAAQKTTILYADVTRTDVTMLNMYGYGNKTVAEYNDMVVNDTLNNLSTTGPLATDIMMMPHHGFDAHPELVAVSESEIYLHTQNKNAIYQPDGTLATEGATAYYDEGDTQVGTFRPSILRNYKAVQRYFTTNSREYWQANETVYIYFTANHAAPTGTSAQGASKDTASILSNNKMTVYTKAFTDAEEYTGWTIDTGVVVTGSITNKTATSDKIQLYRADDLTWDSVSTTFTNASKRYVFVHDQTDLALMHNALDTSSPYTGNRAYGKYFATANEIKEAIANGTIGQYAGYYKSSSGNNIDDAVYFMNSDRDALLWKLDLVTGGSGIGTAATDGMDGFTGSAETTVENIVTSNNTLRKQLNALGIKTYWQVDFEKGLWSEDEPYWLATEDDDPSHIYGELQPNNNKAIQQNTTQNKVYIAFLDETEETTDTNGNGVLDKCDTCVMFYTNGTSNTVYFLTVNEDGLWTRMVFKTSADANDPEEVVYATSTLSSHIDKLKLRVYTYTTQTTSTLTYSGHTNYNVAAGTSESEVMKFIYNSFSVAITSRNGMPLACSGSTPEVGSYWLDTSNLNTNKPGTYTVTAYYRQDDGTDVELKELTVTVQEGIELNREGYVKQDPPTEGTTTKGASVQDEVYKDVDEHGNVLEDCVLHTLVHAYGMVYEEIDVTVGMLTCNDNTVAHYPDGTTAKFTPGTFVDTNVPAGTYYTGLTLSFAGIEQTDNFTLHIEEIKAAEQPAYPQQGSVKVNKTGKAEGVNFNNSGIAKIELSTTGIPMSKGVDLIIVVDLSSSMEYGTDTTDDAAVGDRRIDHLLDALDAMVEDLKNNNADVRIAMSDFGDLDSYAFEKSVIDTNIYHQSYLDSNFSKTDNLTYEFYNHLNFIMNMDDLSGRKSTPYQIADSKFNYSNPSYMGVITPYVYTGNNSPTASAFQYVEHLNMTKIREKMLENVEKSIGTNYDIGLEYAYQMGYAIQQRNIMDGAERDVVCIFMSDGAAMQYNYFSGNTSSGPWVNWLTGNADDLVSNYDYFLNNQSTAIPELKAIQDALLTALKTSGTTAGVSNLQTARSDLDTYQFYRNHSTVTSSTSGTYFYTWMKNNGYIMDWDTLWDIVSDPHPDKDKKTNLDKINEIRLAEGKTACATAEEYLQASTAEEYGALPKTSKQHPELIQLLTTGYYADDADNIKTCTDHTNCEMLVSKIHNPYGTKKYYDVYSGSATDFMTAMSEVLGRELGWNEFVQIAHKNRALFASAYTGTDTTLDTDAKKGLAVMQSLVTKLRSQASSSTASHYTVSPYSYFYNAEGKNWWAEAIKGDTDTLYPVINKYAHGGVDANGNVSPYGYNGDVQNYFSGSSTAGLPLSGQDYISGYKGLDMDLYTISFSIASERQITSDVAESVLRNIATGPSYFYATSDSTGLTNALKSITASMSRGATQAYFVDTLGSGYDLFMGTTYDKQEDIDAQIRVLDYTLDANGNRAGQPVVLETVTFNVEVPNYEEIKLETDKFVWVQRGTKTLKVKSDQKYISKSIYNESTKTYTIMPDYQECLDTTTGLISAKHFYYNTKADAMKIDLTGDGVGDYTLNGESFFWIVGKIGQTETALEYQVYLSKTFDGSTKLGEGVYETNKEAVLHYINYRGTNCELGTVSPSFPWGQGRVGVAFYLVDENGEPIVSQSTGVTGSFEDAVKLTRPVYQDMTFNTTNNITYTYLDADDYLPDGYTLYNTAATYKVYIHSNGSGSWDITDTSNTTYVESKAGNLTVDQSFGTNDYTTADTVVWYAVYVSQPLTVPDTVVVDYGLPVDIHVMANDILFEDNGTLKGVALESEAPKANDTGYRFTETLDTDFKSSREGTVGTASVVGNVVRYEMTKMGMKDAEKFAYAVEFSGSAAVGTNGYYYDTVTVIPATSIYYEDNFLTYRYLEKNANVTDATNRNNWTVLEEVVGPGNYWRSFGDTLDVTQSEDRPGSFNHSDIDADNIYGYDPAYKTCSAYSLGSIMKTTVGSKNGPNNRETTAEAEFTFWGTGFDVVSLTNSNTGVIVVEVFEGATIAANAKAVKRYNVDTYYGYKYNDGKWEADTTNSDSLYQVPVIKSVITDENGNLKYGQYTVRISVVYSTFFDHNNANNSNVYDFYLDAIRIYDPANDGVVNGDDTIQEIYKEDGEYKPDYEELRNLLITADSYDAANSAGLNSQGAVFIDGFDNLDDENDRRKHKVITYTNYGPNNEVYLAPGQTVAFKLESVEGIKEFHIAMKKAGEDNGKNGNAVVKVYAAETNTIDTANAITISTATDMYYDFTSLVGKTIVIHNAGSANDGILSITNLKMTTATGEGKIRDLMMVNGNVGLAALNSLIIDEVEDPFILAGANTVLGGVLDMNFFIDPADLNGTDYYAEIALYTEDGIKTTIVPYADWEVRSNYLVVTQTGLAARQMADKIEVVIRNGDGTPASDVWTDSIRDYAMRIMEKQGAETKTMLVDMLNYGAAAQNFFEYNMDDLANNQLTDAQKAYATDSVSCTDQSVKGQNYYGSTLTLKDRIILTMYFQNITTDMYAVVSFTDHKGAAHETRIQGSDFVKYNDTVYGVVVDGLVVADGDQLVTVTVYDAEGNVVGSASDSVNSYAARQMGKDALYEMVAKFTASAYAYFH